jgi:hypothetical protein
MDGCSASTTLTESDRVVDGGQSVLLYKTASFCIYLLNSIDSICRQLTIEMSLDFTFSGCSSVRIKHSSYSRAEPSPLKGNENHKKGIFNNQNKIENTVLFFAESSN